MTTYKCKICGGQATIDSNNGVFVCNYCGTKQALPLFTAESERLLYDRGNNYLLHSEYDKAENVFSQLLTIKPNAAELYWDLVLCKYGVTYVKDPKTGKYIPTCNRTHYTPIFSDENYKKAIELSTGEKKALFEEDAKTIDNIQKGIIAVSKKEKPFDIFISYKETDANGNRTKDSIEAQKLYEKLTEAGYKVFFSRITLEDKIGTEYEPYIYAALYSSKVMLTICSSKENIEAVWVKNEWSRFLGFRQNDNSKTLLPLYFDMDKADLPEEFALFSAYDMQVDGFAEELLRGIKKLIPLPIMKAKRRKQILKTAGITVASLVVVAGIAAAVIIPKAMKEKRIAEEQAIQASEAAALEAANREAYQAAQMLFEQGEYTAAVDAFNALGEYKDSAQMATKSANEADYYAAMTLFDNADYTAAVDAFNALGEYKDSAQMATKSANEADYYAAMTLFDNADYTAAADAFVALGEYKDSAYMVERCAIQPDYDAAMQLYYDGKYAQATWAFEALGDYEDAAVQKEKAELSWRKSLSTVAVKNFVQNYSYGSYYINTNGSVNCFISDTGSSHNNVESGTHGKVIAISNGAELFALHEDGFVDNISQNADVDENEWVDVVQITPFYLEKNVALKADGTIILETRTPSSEWGDGWLNDAADWKNIVMLATDFNSSGNASYSAALVGVDVNGDAHLCYQPDFLTMDYSVKKTFMDYPNEFRDIHTIDITISFDYVDGIWIEYVNAVAIRNDGKIVSYVNGVLSIDDADDVVDVAIDYLTIYTLHKNGDLYKWGTNNRVLKDVVGVFSDYLVTRSGTIYSLDNLQSSGNEKACIYDEWLTRME